MPNLRPPDAHDYETMARTIFGEARGEPVEGQIAVAHVICNRWRSGKWFGAISLAGVCLKRLQFSAWNPDDPNYHKMMDARPYELEPFIEIAKEAIGDLNDPTRNSTHYCVTSLTPKWAEGKMPVVVIGNHKFYNNIS